jgi:hypothetical protein
VHITLVENLKPRPGFLERLRLLIPECLITASNNSIPFFSESQVLLKSNTFKLMLYVLRILVNVSNDWKLRGLEEMHSSLRFSNWRFSNN